MGKSMKNKKEIRQDLCSETIEIRRYLGSYGDVAYEAIDESRGELIPWMFWATPEYSLEDARANAKKMEQAWDDGEIYSFVIFEKDSGRVLGGCGLNNIDTIHKRANLGYWTRSSKTGRGTATTAIDLLKSFSFDDLGLIRLELVVSIKNEASKRVAEKAGAHFEGILKNRLMLKDGPHDAWGFSLTP